MVNQSRLERDCALSLEERAVRFHRQFPEARISAQGLSKLYKRNRIKRKAIIIKKTYNAAQMARLGEDLHRMKQDIIDSVKEKRRLLFVDECLFSAKAA